MPSLAQQQNQSSWSPATSAASKSGAAQVQTRPFVAQAGGEKKERSQEEKAPQLPDPMQAVLSATAAPPAPTPPSSIQRKEEQDPDETETESEIQRKYADCAGESGEDEDKPSIQAKLSIGKTGDRYEQEADQMAAKVVSMPDPIVQRSVSPLNSFIRTKYVQRKGDVGTASAGFEQRLQGTKGGGAVLGDDVRGFMEPRFGADFSQVRIHTYATAVQLSKEVGAQAFAHGNDIYFNSGKYAPSSTGGKELLAHELTHTIQQTGEKQINKASVLKQDEVAEQPVQAKTIQNNIVPLKLNALQTRVTEDEPLQAKSLEEDTAQYDNHSVVQLKTADDEAVQAKTANRLEQKTAENKVNPLKPDLLIPKTSEETLPAKSAESLPVHAISQSPLTMNGKAVQTKLSISSAPSSIQRWGMGSWILGKVGQLASNMPGFTLLCTLLGKNPVTGKAVERSATSVIGGILTFIGQGQLFQQLKESNAIENAFAWFSKQIAKLNLTWTVISGLFKKAWDSLSKWDLLSPVKAFNRIANIFSGPIKRIRNFASSVISKVGEFIFEGAMKLAGAAGKRVMGIIKQAGGVIGNIIKNPIGFVGNLIKAVKGGFTRFAANIGTHLKTGLMGWLFGALAGAGLTLPKVFDLKGIFDIVLQVIGATYANVRKMLVDKIGEKRVEKLEKAFEFVKLIATEGLAGAWRKLMEFAGNLTDMVIGGIKNWVMKSVVGAAITKLVTMFNPAGAVVQAIISIYNTIMFFVERAQQIAALATSVFNSIGKIAAGNVGAAVTFIEQAMARTLPVIISFLARQVGLGDVAGAIKGIIGRVQGVIQGAIGKLVNFVVSRAKSLLGKIRGNQGNDANQQAGGRQGQGKPGDGEVGETVRFNAGGEGHRLWINVQGNTARVMVASTPTTVEAKLKEWEGKLDSIPQKNQEEARPLIVTVKQQLGITTQKAQNTVKEMEEAQRKPSAEANKEAEQADQQTEAEENSLAKTLKNLFDLFDEEHDLSIIYHENIKNIDPNAQATIKKYLEAPSSQLSKLQNWSEIEEQLKKEEKILLMLDKPLLVSHAFGKAASENQAKPALLEALKEKSRDEASLGKSAKEFIDGKKRSIHASSKPKTQLSKQVFHKDNKATATQSLKEYFLNILEGNKFGHLDRKDIRKILKEESKKATGDWAAVFATGGIRLRKAPDGNGYPIKLKDVWKENNVDPGKAFTTVRSALIKTIKADGKFQKSIWGTNQASDIQIQQYCNKLSANLIEHMAQKDLFFVKHTEIPRNFEAGPHLIKNKALTSINRAKYSEVAKKAKHKALAKLEGQIHHAVPLYIAGGSEVNSLVRAEGGAAVAGSAHNAMHQFIDELTITNVLSSTEHELNLDWKSLSQAFPDKVLKIIIGTIYLDGSITYKETGLKYEESTT